jgi:hypothetical protein
VVNPEINIVEDADTPALVAGSIFDGVRASHGRVLRGLWTMLSSHSRTMRNLGDPNLFQDWIVGQGKTGALRLVRKSDQLIVMLRSMKEVI